MNLRSKKASLAAKNASLDFFDGVKFEKIIKKLLFDIVLKSKRYDVKLLFGFALKSNGYDEKLLFGFAVR